MANDIKPIDVNIIDISIPNFDAFEDHVMHRKAKVQKLRGHKPRVSSDPGGYQPNIVTCPECGVTFDANITITKVTKSQAET